jgi:lipopolysaccharide transport system ATP-binding protein
MEVIKVENLSKQYHLGLIGTGTIRDDFTRLWARIRGKEDPTLKIGMENSLTVNTNSDKGKMVENYVWALRNVNFELQKGEVLGIIGKNGAGKSTLLKILSKVTTPTTGQVKIRGRIASLLEVGTGFHPELTGRENIFLNGAILGMTKTEIRSKFDEIVEFSGVEKYIDTPVKRYSSGMYVRLAFAVAAHLEPEILIVDEVLAVGDAEFQKKCLGKMKDVSGQGRTVIFVSHNMNAINDLCSKCIYMKRGTIEMIGETKQIVGSYISESLNFDRSGLLVENYPRGLKKFGHRARIISMQQPKEKYLWKEKPEFSFTVRIDDPMVTAVEFGFAINGSNGSRVFTYESNKEFVIPESRQLSLKMSIDQPTLVPSKYYISLGIRSSVETLDAVDDFLTFDVLDVDAGNNYFGFTQGPEISGYIDTEVKVGPL